MPLFSNFDVDGAYKAEFDPCFGEVQAANTADGKYTIVKWLEGSVADAKTTDNADVYKSLTTMYVAAKYYTSSTWKIYQLTDNSTFDAHYFMPNTVPNDLVNVPMLCIKPFLYWYGKLQPAIQPFLKQNYTQFIQMIKALLYATM